MVYGKDLTQIGSGQYLAGPTASRPGYEFLGWYTDAQFTQPFDFNATPISSNITLYARWIEIEALEELYEFSLVDDTSYSIKYKQGTNTEITTLVLPSSYHGLPITNIDESAFVNCTCLTSITISNSVTSIGNYVFASDSLTIYIESESVPDGWDNDWDSGCSTRVLFYGMDWEYDADGNPVEINK